MTRPAVRRFLLVGLVLPAVLTVIGLAIQLSVMPSLPDQVAVHWGESGAADRFGSAWTFPITTLATGIGVPALIVALVLPGMRRGGRGSTYRFIGAMACGTAALVVVLSTWALVMQVGVTDVANGPLIWLPMGASFVAAIIGGVAAWYLQPREDSAFSAHEPAPTLALAAGERAVWTRTVSVGTAGVVSTLVAVLVLAGSTILVWLTADSQLVWPFAVITLLLIVVIATTLSFHVRVDEKGLTVTSALGVPRFRIPLADIEAASSVQVNPLGDFGGWGIRYFPGRFGVVLRTGDALQVLRRNGKSFVVTVDDAETAAGLLEALVKRSAGSRP